MTPSVIQSTLTPSPSSSYFQMLNLNEVRLSGRLAQDPAIRCAIVGTIVVNLNVAVNRSYQDASGKWHKETALVPVTVWNRMTDYCAKGLRKGTPLYVEGRLLTDTWKSVDGKRHSALKVHASRVQTLRKNRPFEDIPTAPESSTLH